MNTFLILLLTLPKLIYMFTKKSILLFLFFFSIHAGFAQVITEDSLIISPQTRDTLSLINERINIEKELSLEIDGLLIDETLTKAGQDFFDLFYQLWEPPPGATNFMIRIVEKPFRGISTSI